MKTQKQVTIIARYIHKTDGKPNGTITYLVRASNGVDTYCTTIVNGVASGCSCPARSKCYHKTQLEQKEQERKEVASQFAAKSVPSWTINLVKVGTLVAPKPVVEKAAQDVVNESEYHKTQVMSTSQAEKAICEAERRIEAGKDLSATCSLNGAMPGWMSILPSRQKIA